MGWEALGQLGVMFGVGYLQKHKTQLDHRMLGPIVNAAIGIGSSWALDPSAGIGVAASNGIALAAAAELGLSGTKSVRRIGEKLRKRTETKGN